MAYFQKHQKLLAEPYRSDHHHDGNFGDNTAEFKSIIGAM
jgi:hypothetical protein